MANTPMTFDDFLAEMLIKVAEEELGLTHYATGEDIMMSAGHEIDGKDAVKVTVHQGGTAYEHYITHEDGKFVITKKTLNV